MPTKPDSDTPPHIDVHAEMDLTRPEGEGRRTERTESQWRHMSPATVCAGSPAQIRFCIADAQRDIVSALDEIDRLRAENAELRESLWKISLSPTPSANATVRKMAAIATEALSAGGRDDGEAG